MNELREPDLPRTMKLRGGKALRAGWTTGSCAAAAAKAAALALGAANSGDPSARGARPDTATAVEPPTSVEIALPGKDGRWLQRVGFAVASCEQVSAGIWRAVVVKDAGDDPDVTHGARLTATVSRRPQPGIELDGGEGVGVVTKPGLGLELGGPAINPVPREMIARAVGEAIDLENAGVRVVISVPGGEVMARKTTNRRLGILGGISILGTTGIVRPFSTAAWRASVEQAVAVLAAQAEAEAGAGAEAAKAQTEGASAGGAAPLPLVLCTGGRTEKGAMALFPDLPEGCFVEVGDFTGAALRQAAQYGIADVVFVGMVGKLSKLASGVLMTHYTRSAVDTDVLAQITAHAAGAALAEEVRAANTARHAYEVWEAAGVLDACGAELCDRVADVLPRFVGGAISARVAMVDFTGARLVAASASWGAR
ncbi:MAG TPA: cobalt-precorrin-5B (C(1))-methyltransferase CbiD [Actinocrinis sp.]|jgi:cobalt-precorrin-5B (C1)-methyltransferase